MIYYKWLDLQNYLITKIVRNKKNLFVGKNLIVRGSPIIDIRNGAKIKIGNNVTLNSQNFGYHFNLNAPVKLFANINKDAFISIGDNTRIHGTCIHAKAKIEIGKNCLIAGNSQIFDCNAHTLSMDDPANRINTKGEPRPIKINDNVWIGANCIILPGVTIGEGSVIGAGSVVTKDIPARTIVAGNPARPIEKKEGDL